jgi:hypothetical protein
MNRRSADSVLATERIFGIKYVQYGMRFGKYHPFVRTMDTCIYEESANLRAQNGMCLNQIRQPCSVPVARTESAERRSPPKKTVKGFVLVLRESLRRLFAQNKH